MQNSITDYSDDKLKLNETEVKALLATYEKYKPIIKSFLLNAAKRDDEHLATELMFCLQTSQSSARTARDTVNRLISKGILFTADSSTVLENMEGVRFPDKKSVYLVSARNKLGEIKRRLDIPKTELREWLINNIDGMGMKLASHYMRNIGIFGMAILDIHVQNFMARNGILKGEVGKLNNKLYLENEKAYLKLSSQLGIPPEELDIAIWMLGNGTGEFYG